MGRFNFLRKTGARGQKPRLMLGLSINGVVALIMRGGRVASRVAFAEGDEAQQQAALGNWLKAESASGFGCEIVLMQGLYQLVQVEKPAVEEHELADALVWTVKDLVSIPAEQLQLDYLDIPAATAAGRINVTVADKRKLKPWLELLLKHNLTPQLISMEELALVESTHSQQFPVLLLSQHSQHELLLLIAYQQQLFVSRRVRGFNAIDSLLSNSLMLDSLILETQRAMDYFESGMRQPPVKQIWLNFDSADADALSQAMAAALPVEISPFGRIGETEALLAAERVLHSLACRQEAQG